MVSTSGAKLLPPEAVENVRTKLLPLATVLTPNIPEAIALLKDAGQDVRTPSTLEEAKEIAKQVHELGPQAVLLKGGHMPLKRDYSLPQSKDEAALVVVDVLYHKEQHTVVETDYLRTNNTHGTGCSLASAIAANLARGEDMEFAVHNACRYVGAGIKRSFNIGKGSGPINHFHSIYHLPFAP